MKSASEPKLESAAASHPSFARLFLHHQGMLPLSVARAVERHLVKCDACREVSRDMFQNAARYECETFLEPDELSSLLREARQYQAYLRHKASWFGRTESRTGAEMPAKTQKQEPKD